MKDAPDFEIDAPLLLRAYAAGVFPMADSAEAEELFWVDPQRRGILPLGGFHLSRSLRRTLLKGPQAVTVDRAFDDVVAACADREETWINGPIRRLYADLHAMGQAHSVEVWVDGTLAGAIYGVTLGSAFFGESMVSRRSDGSKIALAWLVARLKAGGFTLFDTQFTTAHLERLGARSVPRSRYHALLREAVATRADFFALPEASPPARIVEMLQGP
ncbi:MAG TPA: leucyl/phenylalanyl-tRNA--protein transferase [Thermohalobaculum sp.]|nr:leucyl/phenylalanyl-tRNA--protein transferase [Thermohalobaculum sp.]